MKKILLFLLSFVAQQGYAQMEITESFDFSNPTQLTPSVMITKGDDGKDYDGAVSAVFTTVFKAGNIEISFGRDGNNGGSWIQTQSTGDPDIFDYSLVLYH
jgi:hypothetical protein